jgi:hypothetical protein
MMKTILYQLETDLKYDIIHGDDEEQHIFIQHVKQAIEELKILHALIKLHGLKVEI